MHLDGETFWGVFTPFLVLSLILGVPRWGEKYWFAWSLSKLCALLLLGVGLVGAAIPAFFEGRRAHATIYEKRLPGSAGAQGSPPRVLDEFHVARAGVEHLITFSPSRRTEDPKELPDVGITVTVLGPDGRQVASFDGTFHALETVEEEVYDWTSFEGRFTPAATGPHRIAVTYRSAEIPVLFMRIENRNP